MCAYGFEMKRFTKSSGHVSCRKDSGINCSWTNMCSYGFETKKADTTAMAMRVEGKIRKQRVHGLICVHMVLE